MDSNLELNKLLEDNSKYFRKDFFKSIEPSSTIKLDPRFLEYSDTLKVLICSKCLTTLSPLPITIKKHLKKNHLKYYKSLASTTLSTKLKAISTLEYTTYNSLSFIEPNKYYFPSLELNLNGFKCLECFYTSISNNIIRKHINKEHNIIGNKGKKSTPYLKDIPLLIIKGLDKSTKLSFIPKLPTKDLKYKDTIKSSSNSSIASNSTKSKSIDLSLELEDFNSTINNLTTTSFSNRVISNKELSFFIKLTRYNKYLEDKDTSILLELINLDLLKET
ncbi:hypothetical protein AUEXF2481DRAFT_32902 [Aureobasidium subglaciale EXF-2481]|uniref:Uncharacterized protein n=1 Tax=Aureobasidium subglaciale (strain EXF-2481) TaxID=1043005 RepID=A0A074Y1A2_AURSE|nr:uncharacterized protein AUEXF2481DRAFT_32902 [Aureobasidium subglaciale EXF-2481]KEQ91515.1 hypothetical protein AUEXF2481DRAFT_32902 [Aureobasidium subglaciale EXF-2481]